MTTLAPAPQIASGAPIPAPGHMGVDYEQRVDFDRLRYYRLARARAALHSSECGALLLFDFYNIRYTTQTWIGGALGDKMTRYALLTRDAASRCCGTSGRRPSITASTPRGWTRRTATRACSGCAGPSPRRPA